MTVRECSAVQLGFSICAIQRAAQDIQWYPVPPENHIWRTRGSSCMGQIGVVNMFRQALWQVTGNRRCMMLQTKVKYVSRSLMPGGELMSNFVMSIAHVWSWHTAWKLSYRTSSETQSLWLQLTWRTSRWTGSWWSAMAKEHYASFFTISKSGGQGFWWGWLGNWKWSLWILCKSTLHCVSESYQLLHGEQSHLCPESCMSWVNPCFAGAS